MSSGPSAPAAPDPVATAKAQGEMNKDTAITQYRLNATDQYTPQGSLQYEQVGTWEDGTPRFRATQTYSSDQQAIYDQGTKNSLKLGQTAGDALDRVSTLLASPVDLSNDAVEGRLMELGRKRLDPVLAERRSQLETKLANQGITPGSEAWTTQMRQLGETENDAFNNLLLTGRGQSVSEILAGRNQPINEITALMSGSQVSQPGYVTTPQSSVAPVDYTGLVQSNYNAQMDAYKTQVGQGNAMMGGLFGLGSSAIRAAPYFMASDRRLKTAIRRFGTDARGLGLYLFRYIWDPIDTIRAGFMADEVEAIRPDAVGYTVEGFRYIDTNAMGWA